MDHGPWVGPRVRKTRVDCNSEDNCIIYSQQTMVCACFLHNPSPLLLLSQKRERGRDYTCTVCLAQLWPWSQGPRPHEQFEPFVFFFECVFVYLIHAWVHACLFVVFCLDWGVRSNKKKQGRGGARPSITHHTRQKKGMMSMGSYLFVLFWPGTSEGPLPKQRTPISSSPLHYCQVDGKVSWPWTWKRKKKKRGESLLEEKDLLATSPLCSCKHALPDQDRDHEKKKSQETSGKGRKACTSGAWSKISSTRWKTHVLKKNHTSKNKQKRLRDDFFPFSWTQPRLSYPMLLREEKKTLSSGTSKTMSVSFSMLTREFFFDDDEDLQSDYIRARKT